MTEPLDVADRVLEMVGDRGEARATVTAGTQSLTRFANNHIHQHHVEESETVQLAVVVDGRAAAGSANQTDDATLRNLADRVLEAARLRPADPDWPGVAPPSPVSEVEHFDAATADADPGLRADLVKAFIDQAEGTQAAGYCSTTVMTTAFANSAGQRVQRRHTSAVLDGIHQAGGGADGGAHQSSASVGDLDGASAGKEAARRARASVETIELPPGRYEVVLERSCVADMLQFLCWYGFNAKSFLDGTSFVHQGEAQFDGAVSIWDDATDPRTLGIAFDAEGTPKRRVGLVEGGVTTGLVHDRRTAKRAGAESTGHSVGMENFGAVPQHLFFGAGTASREDLIASVERGLLVCDFWYTRILDPKTQVVTGLTRNGLFLIEDGRIGSAVANLRFTQSYAAALAPGKVKGVGGDAALQNTAHVPSLHLSEWNFTGGAKG